MRTYNIVLLWQLKMMVSALLHESDLVLSDDVVEMIVDKVQIPLICPLPFTYALFSLKYWF